ncbi:MAG: hypothetical protein GWN73_03325, partial [Actinobacteria bacterium]|nr:hypothetical protein [Actinomycetota bacterium]NIU64508.1 hypothetical protein [Actinomycetota bacterium]
MASMGDVIALGTGTYEEVVILPPGVTLYGACPSETIIRESSGGSAVVTASGADVRVANLTIGASGRPGADAAGAGRSLVLDDVIVESTTDMGVVAAGGGRIEARRVVIRDIVPTGGLNRGLSVESGGVFEGEDVVVDGAALVGLYVTGAGSTATIDGVALVGTREGDNSGLGMLVTAGGAATLRRAAIEGNEGAGGFTDGEGTTLVIEDSVLRGNLPTARGEFGRALNFERGAHGDLRRVYVGGHRDVAFYL